MLQSPLSPANTIDQLTGKVAGKVAGTIEATLDGQVVSFAALTSKYLVDIQGDVASVEVEQTFVNPYDQPLNAQYLFPLNQHAAVHAMTMTVGSEVISAEIQEIRQAKNTFDAAKKAGKAGALLQQHRPNMFTQSIANLMPGRPIKMIIKYTQLVPKIDGAFELVIPMVVGPRFQPAGVGVVPAVSAGTTASVDNDAAALGTWLLEQLPMYPNAAGVDIPLEIIRDRVSLSIELEAQLPLVSVISDTHPMLQTHVSSTQQTLAFADGQVLDNKDFVLRYAMAGGQTSTGLLTHWEEVEGGYFSLLIEPPAQVSESQILPREMVFLLDCSGSMRGLPMQASKQFMRRVLQQLRPTDTFRIIRFSDSATEFSSRPLPATPLNVARGLIYTDQLYGSGGTVMTSGIQQALGLPEPAGTVRNVVFLTDGYIGNEFSVLKLVEELRGHARLFAFGVGAGVNRYLLSELGRVGQGFTRYFDSSKDGESVEVVAQSLANRLQSPVLTNVELDWGSLPVEQVVPIQLPDLYAGDTLRVTGRYTTPATGRLTIHATAGGRDASIVAAVDLQRGIERPAIRRAWARNSVAELMHMLITPVSLRPDEMFNTKIQSAVTELGLLYELATKWTAFVAVSRRVVNTTPSATLDAQVALPHVAGVSKMAYAQPAMTGYAAPEPGLLLGVIAAFFAIFMLRLRAHVVASNDATIE